MQRDSAHRWTWFRLAVASVIAGAAITGCGGGAQDIGGLSRNLGGDIAPGYDTSIMGANRRGAGRFAGAGSAGVYAMIETAFHLPSVPGDPFDYERVNVQVELRKPDGGTTLVPAFFDGGTTWRARYTPTAPGAYAVASVLLNRKPAHEAGLSKKDWTVSGAPEPGFVRIDPGDHRRFVFDSGQRYFPLGQDQAWRTDKLPDIPALFAKMRAAGENWSRVWMTSWGGTSLTRSQNGKPPRLGDFDLIAARRWDDIVAAAGKNDIYFQMVIEHHGAYSTTVDPTWNANPYNAKNGGPLTGPDSFFTNPEARDLTQRLLYYVLARWGYSPNIMAFELFNEVENTNAARGGHWADIASWHREMASFVRRHDGYHHLITTSALPGVAADNGVWSAMDYVQEHIYPDDIVTALATIPSPELKLNKPVFAAEFGPAGLGDDPGGRSLHAGIWSSMLSGMSGAAGYWDWADVDTHDLYGEYRAAADFLKASALPQHGSLISAWLPVDTPQRAALQFQPTGGWASASRSSFVVTPSGPPADIAAYPTYLQGRFHRSMTPTPLTLSVDFAQPGAFSVHVAGVAKAGAVLRVSVDGSALERPFAAADRDYAPPAAEADLRAEVQKGAHTITIEDTGNDWLRLGALSLSNYGPALRAEARLGRDFAAAWLYRGSYVAKPDQPADVTAKVTLLGLEPGGYRVTWWDTKSGKPMASSDLTVPKRGEGVVVDTPPIGRDAALFVVRAGERAAAAGSGSRRVPGASVAAPARR